MDGSAGRAWIAWPADRIMVASAAPGTHQLTPCPDGPPGTRVNVEGGWCQLSPLTLPPQMAVLIEMAYPSLLVRNQW